MEINKQKADTIINVGGNFNNTGELNIKAMYLNVDEKQLQNIVQPDQSTLKVQFSIDYLTTLEKNFDNKILIQRTAFKEVKHLLSEKLELVVVGQPGVGKSCLLFELSKEDQDVIYISLKNKSIKTVVLHLINKINLRNGQQLIYDDDIDSCLEILQGLLVSSELTFFIDECEAAVETIARILLLNKFGNKFLYASQNSLQFTACNVNSYLLATFDIEESQQYLSEQGIVLDLMKFNKLYETSQGNALYLFYYSQFIIDPLPKDLTNYHSAIWTNLSNKEKECLIFVSLAYLPISVTSVNLLVSFDNLQDTTDFVNKLRLITISDNGYLTIFHPSFKDFVVNELSKFSTLKTYKIKLGEFFQFNGDFVQATFLLIDIKPRALQEFGFEALPDLISRGDLELANRLIEVLLSKKRSSYVTGYLKFHLYSNLRLLNKTIEADQMLEESLKLLKSTKDRKLYLSALMGKAIDLVQKGENDAGLKLADSIMADKSCADEVFKGQLLVSLSKIYVDLHQFTKAANAAKIAYDFFCKSNHLYGLVSSLSNLASALACTDTQKKLAEKYALKLLELPLDKINYGTKLIALNVLTSLNRQNRNYIGAKKYGHQAVFLCQHYKLEQKAILNLINYGNVIRDTGDVSGAIGIYEEALAHSLKLDLPKEQSRVYRILSSIYLAQGDNFKSLELIDASIALAEKINYDYGTAHGHDERGAILSEMKLKAEAGKDYEKAFHIFKSMDDKVKETRHCLTNAILCYMEVNDTDRLNALIDLSLNSFDTNDFIDLGGISDYDEVTIDIHDYFYRLTEKSITSAKSQNLILSYLDYLKFCKKKPSAFGIEFQKLLLLMSNNTNSNNFLKPNLAVLIEQSCELLNNKDLKQIINVLSQTLNGFIFRETEYDYVFLVNLADDFNLELICYKDELLNVKLIIDFLLFVYSLPHCLTLKKDKKESFCKITLINYSTLITHLKMDKPISIKFDEHIQTEILNRPNYSVPIHVVVNDSFSSFSDLLKHENNKCNMFFVRTLLNAIICHFYHTTSSVVWKYTKTLTQKIAYLYDYTMVSPEDEIKSDYDVDLTKLDKALKEMEYE